MKLKRGDTCYIPCVLPETWCLGVAFILTFISSILLFSAAGTVNWQHTHISIDSGVGLGNNKSYDISYGLRRITVDYCIRDTVVDLANEGGLLCGHESVFYTDCTTTAEFCKPAPTSDLTFAGVCIIVSGIMCLAAICCQMVKRYMHFVFHIPLIIAAPFGVAFARGGVEAVELSEVLTQTGKDGIRRDSLEPSFAAAVVACLFIWLAFILLVLDFCYQRSKDGKKSRSSAAAVPPEVAPPQLGQGLPQRQPQQQPQYQPQQQPPQPGHGSADGI